jgi:hypothetical protein
LLSLRLRAAAAVAGGDFADGERLAGEALAVGRRPLGAADVMANDLLLVFLRWLQGRPGEVAALLERLAAERAWGSQAWPRLLPLAYAGQGRQAEARQALDAALDGGLDDRAAMAVLVALVGACAQLGDAAAADRLAGLLAPWAGHHLAGPELYLGPADHHLGMLAATAGRWDDSRRHFRVALAATWRLRARPWHALAARAYAGMLRGRGRPGDTERAAALDATGRAISGRLGMALPGWGRPSLGPRP